MRAVRSMMLIAIPTTLLFACERRENPETTSTVSAAKSAPVGAQASAVPQGEAQTPSLARHMQDHFTRGVQIRDAVVAGDLKAVKAHAQWMAEHHVSEDLPDTWAPFVKALQDAAKQVLDAPDIKVAATHTATMSRACGECHAKLGGPKLAPSEPPAEGSGAQPHMVRHQWAAARMWDALTVPSEEAWRKAVEVMADAPLTAEAVQGKKSIPPETTKLAKEVHDIAEAARADREMEKWSVAYGSFLGTCAECHRNLKAGPTAP